MLTPEQIEIVNTANNGLRFFLRTSEFIDTPDFTGWRDWYQEVYPQIVLKANGINSSDYPFSVANGDRIVNGALVDSPLFKAVYIGQADLDQDVSTEE